jgi:Na+/phosphate symporter
MDIIRMKEQEMNRQIVVNEEALEELIRKYRELSFLYMEDAGGKMSNEEIEAYVKRIDDEIVSIRERLITNVLTAGSMAGEVLLLPYTKE